MALNFPSTPIDGQLFDRYIYNDAKGVWDIVPDDIFPYYVGQAAPSNPKQGTAWFNTENGKTYMFYDDGVGSGGTSGQWVATSGVAVTTNQSQLSELADVGLMSLQDGDMLSYSQAFGLWENINPRDQIVRLNPKTVSENLTIPSGYNGTSAGPLTVSDGITVTIADGSVWSIV